MFPLLSSAESIFPLICPRPTENAEIVWAHADPSFDDVDREHRCDGHASRQPSSEEILLPSQRNGSGDFRLQRVCKSEDKAEQKHRTRFLHKLFQTVSCCFDGSRMTYSSLILFSLGKIGCMLLYFESLTSVNVQSSQSESALMMWERQTWTLQR